MGKYLNGRQDIVDVYETNCHHTEARLLHKLNDQHVIPEKIKKMKVGFKFIVFSQLFVFCCIIVTIRLPIL